MKKSSKAISIILAVLMVISIIPISASATEVSGTCGENLTWTFDDSTGTLTISGLGEMEDYQRNMSLPLYSIPPWDSYWNNIISIVIDEGITYIGEETFTGYANLTSVTIPDSVTAIGGKAFYDCTSLTSITLPDSVTDFSSNVFYNTAYYNDESNWENGVLYIDNHLISCKQDFSGSCVIKDGTKTIAKYALKDCTSLTSITIPDSLIIIGERAFYNCKSLRQIGIPDNVKKIGYCAFYNCKALTDIGISGDVTDISSGAFLKCILRYVFYTGTEEQWKSLKVSGSDAMLNASQIHYNCSKVVTLPTCTEQGYTTFSCHDCEISQPQSINSIVTNYTEAKGHTEEILPAVAPTCTETGLTEGSHCSGCNEIYVEQEIIDALGHTDDNDDGICDTCDEQLCSCNCHKTGIVKFFWQIINFVQKIFGKNLTCTCGKVH